MRLIEPSLSECLHIRIVWLLTKRLSTEADWGMELLDDVLALKARSHGAILSECDCVFLHAIFVKLFTRCDCAICIDTCWNHTFQSHRMGMKQIPCVMLQTQVPL